MTRTLLVQGHKQFKVTIPDDARVTFGPFSPPSKSSERYGVGANDRLAGTLRVYDGKSASKESILGVFTNVTGFRDLSVIEYEEEVAREEGAILWKSDKDGYKREEKVRRQAQWVDPLAQLETSEEEEDSGF